MRFNSSRRRTAASSLAVMAAASLILAGCGSSSDNSSAPPSSSSPCGTTDNVTLTIGLFGSFGFSDDGMWDKYKAVCPNITVKEDDTEQSGDYWTALQPKLASGSGLDDIQGIEIGFVADVLANHADQFVNWQKVANSSADLGEFYDWKEKLATTADGSDTVGLGTDIGPEAMCYRKDLFQKAGLPTDPDELASKISTWDDYINLGKQYEASSTKPANSKFVDSASSIFDTAVYQGTEAYDTTDGTPDVENSDGVANAWKYATEASAAGISAGLSEWTPEWNKAFSDGAFATIACPSWMIGYIQGQGGDATSGKWDIIPALPGGSTNWGGSWLGVPTASKNQAAAIALVEWLSAKDQQVAMFADPKAGGHFPSNQEAAADPKVASATNPYFSNAPTGAIFGKIASAMKIPPIGTYDTPIQTAFGNALTNVETKGTSPDDAWKQALDAIKQVTG